MQYYVNSCHLKFHQFWQSIPKIFCHKKVCFEPKVSSKIVKTARQAKLAFGNGKKKSQTYFPCVLIYFQHFFGQNSSANSAQGASGSQIEDAEEDESSSSSLVQDELENFREKWIQDLASKGTNVPINAEEPEQDSVEEKARGIFLEGVEHEQNGELYEAIQKYRKAVALVPDIEFKAFEHTARRKPVMNATIDEKNDATDDEADLPDLPGDVGEEDSDVQDLLTRFTKLKLKG